MLGKRSPQGKPLSRGTKYRKLVEEGFINKFLLLIGMNFLMIKITLPDIALF